MRNIQTLYRNRFQEEDQKKKNSLWGEICRFLEHFIDLDAKIIVDVAAGYCDFINNFEYKCKKCAIDIDPDVRRSAAEDVEVFVDNITNMSQYFAKGLVSMFFMSNFLEHISKEDISKLLELEYGLLEPGGEVWILTPNIRYVGGKYWDFYDHITPITEKALIEAGELCGFRVRKCIKKFLPFTTKSRLPKAAWIVRLYLRLMPLSGWIFGEQSFLILKK